MSRREVGHILLRSFKAQLPIELQDGFNTQIPPLEAGAPSKNPGQSLLTNLDHFEEIEIRIDNSLSKPVAAPQVLLCRDA
jgi:hypothetical protein